MAFFISFSYVVAQCFKNVLENTKKTVHLLFLLILFIYLYESSV